MCIIAVKPMGVPTPKKEILKNMFTANPDGAGVAFNLNGNLYIIKGLMSFEKFYEVCKQIPAESSAIYHTRIQTSGGVCAELTHPFILDANINRQRELYIKTNRGEAVAHNGIFSEFHAKENNNDTTQFIAKYLSPLKTLKDKVGQSILDNDLDAVINKLCGTSNKIAIIDEKGNIKKYGENWIFDDGIFYSNTTYEEPLYRFFDRDLCSTRHFDWESKKDAVKAKNNVKMQILKLKREDPYFASVYEHWENYMTDEDILEGYESGWF